jgi:hypothetical protein
MSLILLIVSSLSDCIRQVFTDGDVVLIGETFDGCSSSADGGAVYIDSISGTATIVDCAFLNCSTTKTSGGGGGGLRLLAGESLLSRCSFVTCRSGDIAACASLEVLGALPLNCTEMTSIGATAQFYTFVFLSYSSESSASRFGDGNVSESRTSGCGSAMEFRGGDSLIFEFYEIQWNTGVNCILFDCETVLRTRCLGVRWNVCSGSEAFAGLFSAQTALTIEDSVISGNIVNYFVDSRFTVTFLNCHFDGFSFSTTGGGVPATVDCFTDGANLSWAPGCSAIVPCTISRTSSVTAAVSPTVMPTETVSSPPMTRSSDNGGQSGDASMLVVVIVVPSIVVIVIVCVVLGFVWRRRMRNGKMERVNADYNIDPAPLTSYRSSPDFWTLG